MKLVNYLYEEGNLGDQFSQIESLSHGELTRYSDLLLKAIYYSHHEWKAVVWL